MSAHGAGRTRLVTVPDLAVCAGGLLALVVAVTLGASGPVWAAPGALVVLFVPGYALVAATFAPGLPEWALRSVLACALSAAVAAIGCVLLHALGIRLESATLTAWTVLLGGSALASAWWRRRGHPGPATVAVVPGRVVAANVLVVAGALAGAVVALVGVAREVRPVRGIPAGQVALYAVPQGPGLLAVGISGRNAPGGNYRVVVRSGTRAGTRSRTYPVRLAAGSSWRTTLAVRPDVETRVLLYRESDP